MKKERQFGRRISAFLFVMAFINFGVYSMIEAYLGGTPDYAKSQYGKYYLSSHGNYTEVSERVFTYVEWHSAISWGGLILCGLIIVITSIFEEGFSRK